MNHLYLIGGSARSGKTIILNKVITAKPMIAVQTDAIRDGIRETITKHFSQEISQGDLTWNAVAGLINYYDRKNTSLIIEGIEITPERVKNLSLQNLQIKAAFVGITEDSNLNTMLNIMIEHSNQKRDQLLKKMQESGIDDKVIKARFNEEIEKSKSIAFAANKYGYRFFPFTNNDFQGYCNNVASYLLE